MSSYTAKIIMNDNKITWLYFLTFTVRMIRITFTVSLSLIIFSQNTFAVVQQKYILIFLLTKQVENIARRLMITS